MAIASREFLLLFLPFTLLVFYWAGRTPSWKKAILLITSYIFYALAGIEFVPLLLGLSLATYWAGQKNWIKPAIVLNLLALAIFKYLDFGLENFNFFRDSLGLEPVGLLKLALPLGISFFVFKHIGYLLDVGKSRYPASTNLLTFLTFSAYFPQISAGPISNYNDTAGQLEQLPQKLESNRWYEGLIHLGMGLAKKVFVADTLGALLATSVNKVGGFDGFIPAWYMVLVYSGQLYFDFSGYTDMAIGVSKLFGINLPQNFNNPYLATNPAEFWERWHMSLSQWFRDYLFSPMSRSLLRKWGAVKRERAQNIANLVTMSLVGLWHGASWSFILWGTYHGILLNFNAWWKRQPRSLPEWLTRPLVIISILLGWALFMSPSAEYLAYLFTQLFGFGGLGDLTVMQKLFFHQATATLAIAIPIALSGFAEASNLLARAGTTRSRWIALGLGILMALGIWFMKTNIPFLYAQF